MAVASTSTYRWVVLLLAVLSAIYLYSFYDGSGGGHGQHHVVSSMEEEEAEAYTNIIASAGTPSDISAPEESSDGSNTVPEVEDVRTTTDAVDETSGSPGGGADSEGESESDNDNIQDSTEETEDPISSTSDEPSTEETAETGENEDVKQEEEVVDSSPTETEPSSPQEEKYIFDPTEPFDIDKLLSSVEDGYDKFVEKLKKTYGGDLYYHLLFPDLEWDHDKNPVQMAGGEVSAKRLMRRLQIKLLAPHFYPKEKRNWVVHDDNGDSNTFLWINAGHSASAAHGNLFRQSYTAVMEQFASSVFQSAGLNFTARNYAMGGYEGGLELSLCLEQVYGQGFDMFSWDFGMIDGRHYFALMMMISRIMTMAHKWSLPAETEYDSSNDKFPSMSYMPFIHLNGVDAGRKSVLKKLAKEAGVGGSFLNEISMLDMLKRSVPDAETGDLTKQFELPPALKYFVCKGAVEGGSKDSLCSKHKYDSMSCNANEVKGRVGWHPGWKAHHFQGVTQAKWIVTALRDAVRELHVKFTGDGAGKVSEQESRRLHNTDLPNPSLRQRKMTSNKKETHQHQHQHRRITDPRPSDGATILAQLLMEEHADRMIYMTPPEDKTSWLDMSDRWTNETVVENFNEATLSYSNSLCHVALLPAQARFDGIVLSGEKATSSPPLSMGDDLIMGISKRDFLRDTAAAYKQYFDEETDMHDQHAVEPDGSHERPHPLLLSWEEARTNRDAIGCTNETIKIDYKDFFLVPADVGWVSAIIPNSAELAAYQIPKELDDDSHKDIVEQTRANMLRRRGLIFICPRVCAFNKCPADAIKIPDDLKTSEEDDNGILQIEIDGVAVTGFQRHHGRSCWAMEHATTDALPNVLEWGVKDSYDMRFHIETTGDTNQKKKHLHISSLIVV